MAIECAWMWTLHLPDSALTRWWRQRFAGGGKRLRRIGIVTLARKLMIASWRYDICVGPLARSFDVIIAEQVFEHLLWPHRAARHAYAMLNLGGYFRRFTTIRLTAAGGPKRA